MKCVMCGSVFLPKADKSGQSMKRYCSYQCFYKAKRVSKNSPYVARPIREMVKQISRPVYCPERQMSFTSVSKASQILDVSIGGIYKVLNGECETIKGFSFVDYDFDKHPMPRHPLPLQERGKGRQTA